MRLIFLSIAAMAALATAALGQSGAQNPGSTSTRQPPPAGSATGSSNPAMKTPSGEPATTGSIEPGANSFTEGQARSRIEAQGFGNVTDLRKDDQGIWRGRAMRNGQSVGVMLDYKGNVASQ